MYISKLNYLFFLCFIFCFTTLAYGKEKLLVACTEFAPFFYTDTDGKIKGTLISLADKIITEAGYQIDYKMMPPRRIPVSIKEGSTQVWIGLTSTLTDVALIGEQVVAQMDLMSYSIGPKTPIKHSKDLIGKKIVILAGYTYGGLIHFIKDPKNNINYYEVNSHEAAIRFLESGRADYLLNYKAAIKKYVPNNRIKNLIEQPISSYDMNIAVSNVAPNAKRLLAELEAAYLRLKNNDEL